MRSQLGFRLALTATLFCTLSIPSPSARAEDGIRIPLEKFRQEEEVAVQRGNSVANGACVFNLVEELRAYGGEPTGWFITFDSSTGVKFDSPEFPRYRHACIDGKQITFDRGKRTVAQIYDEDGNATIPEP
jgi:hypothetical protein